MKRFKSLLPVASIFFGFFQTFCTEVHAADPLFSAASVLAETSIGESRPDGEAAEGSEPATDSATPEDSSKVPSGINDEGTLTQPFMPIEMEERFVIGVQCDLADELLRLHLKLGDKGLVVLQVRENTPAVEAGLKVHDIIVSIDGNDLTSREDLIRSVGSSEGKQLRVSIIRAGEAEVIEVTPRMMQVPVLMAPATTLLPDMESGGTMADGLEVRKIHPGVLIEQRLPLGQDVHELVKQLRSLSAERKSGPGRSIVIRSGDAVMGAESQADLEMSVQSLQQQIDKLQKQVQELQERLKTAPQSP